MRWLGAGQGPLPVAAMGPFGAVKGRTACWAQGKGETLEGRRAARPARAGRRPVVSRRRAGAAARLRRRARAPRASWGWAVRGRTSRGRRRFWGQWALATGGFEAVHKIHAPLSPRPPRLCPRPGPRRCRTGKAAAAGARATCAARRGGHRGRGGCQNWRGGGGAAPRWVQAGCQGALPGALDGAPRRQNWGRAAAARGTGDAPARAPGAEGAPHHWGETPPATGRVQATEQHTRPAGGGRCGGWGSHCGVAERGRVLA
jgi:hypothetical protein